jgi:plastocyanin
MKKMKKTIGPGPMLIVAAIALPVFARANGDIIGMVEHGSSRVHNAVVSLVEVPGTFKSSKTVTMNQKDKEFAPHVLAVEKGTTVTFNSEDPFFHNVFSSSRVKTFNVSQEKKGDTSQITFDKPGIVPIRCHIHANMKAFVVVLPNPYFATTNSKGLFKISGVPAGTYTIKVWDETGLSETQSVTVPATGSVKVIFKS